MCVTLTFQTHRAHRVPNQEDQSRRGGGGDEKKNDTQP